MEESFQVLSTDQVSFLGTFLDNNLMDIDVIHSMLHSKLPRSLSSSMHLEKLSNNSGLNVCGIVS